MEPEGLLLCSQQLTTGPYPQPDKSKPYYPNLSISEHFNIILPTMSKCS
jgi:hypothetical protein